MYILLFQRFPFLDLLWSFGGRYLEHDNQSYLGEISWELDTWDVLSSFDSSSRMASMLKSVNFFPLGGSGIAQEFEVLGTSKVRFGGKYGGGKGQRRFITEELRSCRSKSRSSPIAARGTAAYCVTRGLVYVCVMCIYTHVEGGSPFPLKENNKGGVKLSIK